ncbi:DEKNAAC102907 [Brettanomyces naardenensis]|uniref:DEKNAAC102907 n=1 Tax=Brettanomyces naardenensis TaxID=13370 RepID=A0A448YM24_BRENA|nr:DEKNAAC102907 [Brettanomyces naardenensis]
MHSSSIRDKIDRSKRITEQRRISLRQKLDKAVKLRENYIARKRSIASATIRSIEMRPSSSSSSSSSSFLPASPTATTEFQSNLTDLSEEIKQFQETLVVENTTTFDSIRLQMRHFRLFSEFSSVHKQITLKSGFKLLMAVKIMRAMGYFFQELKKTTPRSCITSHSTTFMARSFLYGLTMLVERNYHDHIRRTPTYSVLLENAKQDEVFKNLCKDYAGMRKRFLDNYYYDYLLQKLLSGSLSLWTVFESIINEQNVSMISKSELKFAAEFTTYFNIFQVFRYLHLLRSIASLLEANEQLRYHTQYLETMRQLTDEEVILDQYDSTIKQCTKSMASNEKGIENFHLELRKMTSIREILSGENSVYAEYQKQVLSGTSLTEDNPLTCQISTDSSSSRSLFSSSSFCGVPISMIPPTFSLLEWRRCIMKIYLEYQRSHDIERQNFTFLKTRGAGKPASSSSSSSGFSEYAKYKFQPDVEGLRGWLGLKTFSEGAIEAIEHLSCLDSVDQMMVDVVQMVERCMFSMMIVTRNSTGKVFISLPKRTNDYNLISVLSDAVQSLSKLENGDITLRDYFTASLGVFKVELPDFLQRECEELISLAQMDGGIDKRYIQLFVEFIRDCMIFSINRCVGECLTFVAKRVLEFEAEMLDNTSSSTSVNLDLRFPILFNQMLRQIPKGPAESVAVYRYFNKMFIRMLCSSSLGEFEIPEIAEVFSIQLRHLHGQVNSMIITQSLSALLMTYFGGQQVVGGEDGGSKRTLFNFVSLLREMDSFISGYFEQHYTDSCSFNTFFKKEIVRLLKQNCAQRMMRGSAADPEKIVEANIDSDVIFGLIEQVSKVNIGSRKVNSIRTVYSKTMEELIELFSSNDTRMEGKQEKYAQLVSKFFDAEWIRNRLECLIGDYYTVYDCLYEAYWDSLQGCYNEFNVMAEMGKVYV